MRVIYRAVDGKEFDSELECREYEQKDSLLEFVSENIEFTWCNDAGCSIIEVENVVDFIRTHQAQINQIFERRK